MKDYTFLVQQIVDNEKKAAYHKSVILNTDLVASRFENYLFQEFSDKEFCNLLACSGFIPDLYSSDSSEETLYTKLIEVMVSNWGNRMGYKSKYLKEKASYEDVNINIGNKVIVCDAKSFRLGRSQAAPNVKDFLKLEDMRKWLGRYKNGLGGLVTYPDTHDWVKGSDAYLYCSTKDCPTVMMSYIYLAMILHYKKRFDTNSLIEMWHYNRLFPQPLEKKMEGGNRIPYWNTINLEMQRILNITEDELFNTFLFYKEMQKNVIMQNLYNLRKIKDNKINEIQTACNQMDEKEIREELISYKIRNETEEIDSFIGRIQKFRLK